MKNLNELKDNIGIEVDRNNKKSLYIELIAHADAELEDFLNFAIFLRDTGKLNESLGILNQAEDRFGKNAWIEDNRARAYVLLEKIDDAIFAWERATTLNASEKDQAFFINELEKIYDFSNADISRKILLFKENKQWDDVISTLSEYRKKYQKNIYIYLELCIAYREKKDYRNALKILGVASNKDLISPWIHDNYSRIYFDKKLYVKAIRECLTALSLSSEENRKNFISLLFIMKNQLDMEHSDNKYLDVKSIDVDELANKILKDRVDPADIVLDVSRHKMSSSECKSLFASIENKNSIPNSDDNIKLIAYYLPQFHPIPENDEWWGPGFTEWTNVAQAVPYFKGHYQPRVPGELGYYDLRLPEVREAQAKLAKEYGIYGFCYYYYWFSGRRLLERPLQEVFESGKPDFPFCICWANENWSRRWDGSENEVLVQQVHNEQTDEDFIHDVIPLFKDPRYIKINGAPLLIVYRISLMPNPVQTAQTWRDICAENGIPEIHLCMTESFGLTEPRQYGFNSSVQFPPHGVIAPEENDEIEELSEGFTGKIYDFEKVIKQQLGKELPAYKRFPGVMTAWDNTSRKKKSGNVFINSTPQAYEVWLRGAIDHAKQTLPAAERLVFINAWNEWAEGTHLEPDRKNGRSYLEATRRALMGNSDWHLMLDYAKQLPELAGETKNNFLADMRFALERLAKVNEHLLGILGDHGLPKSWTTMKPGLPASWADLKRFEAGVSWLEALNHYNNFDGQCIAIDSFQKLWIYGWAYHDEHHELKKDTPTYVILEDVEEGTYFAPIIHRQERSDVVANNKKNPNLLFSGIKALFDISRIPSGCYHLSVACRIDKRVIMTPFKVEVEIV